MKHLLLYDGVCGLCARSVKFVLRFDKKKAFAFAPLQGKTAEKLITKLPEHNLDLDTVILVENYQTEEEKLFIFSKGAFRVLWLLGGFWKVFGVLNFLPAFCFDWAYSLIARYRHRLFPFDESCIVLDEKTKKRFLP